MNASKEKLITSKTFNCLFMHISKKCTEICYIASHCEIAYWCYLNVQQWPQKPHKSYNQGSDILSLRRVRRPLQGPRPLEGRKSGFLNPPESEFPLSVITFSKSQKDEFFLLSTFKKLTRHFCSGVPEEILPQGPRKS